MKKNIENIIIDIENNEVGDLVLNEEDLNILAKDDKVDNLGMLYEIVTNSKYCRFIDNDVLENFRIRFIPKYFLKCIKENPDCEWADSRYSAAWDAACWFKKLHLNKKTDYEQILLKFSEDLSNLYLECGRDVKVSIINGFLESVLPLKRCNRFFENWKSNGALNLAIELGSNPRYELPEVL